MGLTGPAGRIPFYGTSPFTGIYDQTSRYSHANYFITSSVQQPLPLVSSVGASVALTTVNTTALDIGYYPFFWIYDVCVWVEGGTGTGTPYLVDLFNTFSAGTRAANSFLNYSIVIPTSLASANNFVYSARAQEAYNLQGDAAFCSGTPRFSKFINNYLYPRGTPLSARFQTPSGGSMTSVKVVVLIVPSDNPNYND